MKLFAVGASALLFLLSAAASARGGDHSGDRVYVSGYTRANGAAV